MEPNVLPLPVAVLRRRSHNAKSAKDLHDTAYFAWEVSVRLAVAAHPPENVAALGRASLGAWVEALGNEALGNEVPGEDASGPGGHALDDGALLAAYRLLVEVGEDRSVRPTRVSARALLTALPAYRNRVIGHGSVRSAAFYERAGPLLLAGVEAAWRAGLFFGGGQMVFVDTVEIGSDGTRRARVLNLMGDHALVVDPRGTSVPEGMRPGRVYVRGEGRWFGLSPFVLFEEHEGIERVYVFDAVKKGGARFLDYAAGSLLRGGPLEERFPGVSERLRERLGVWRPDSGAGGGSPPADEGTDSRTVGEYELLVEIGRGGMGVVHLARQPDLARLAAIKVLPESLGQDALALARFRREIAALGRCEHPNVIRILGSGASGGRPYYAMEYVEGVDLAEVAEQLRETDDFDQAVSSAWAAKRERFAEALSAHTPDDASLTFPLAAGDRYGRLAMVFRDVARGLNHLHEHGIVHRDVKPSNILITAHQHRAVVMDLGLASLSDASQALTETQTVVGTLRYLPPEQIQPTLGPVDRRADVYALGVTLYELVGGAPFVEADTPAAALERVLRGTPRPIRSVDAHVPDDLATIISKATEKDARKRYASAAAVADDLDAFLARRPIAARSPSLRYVLRLAARRNKPTVAVAVAALLLLVGGTVWFVGHLRDVGRREAALRTAAEVSGLRAHGLAEALLVELSNYPDTPETAARVGSFAPAVLAYFGALPLEGLSVEDLRQQHEAFDWIADQLEKQDKPTEALAHRRRSRELLAELARRHPESPDLLAERATLWISEGDALHLGGDDAAARKAWHKGAEAGRALALGSIGDGALDALAEALDGAADTLAELNSFATSIEFRGQVRRLVSELLRRHPGSWVYVEQQMWCELNDGDAFEGLGRWKLALAAWERGQVIRRKRSAEHPEDLTWRKDDLDQESSIADVLAEHGDKPAALARYRVALAGGEVLQKADPDLKGLRPWLADLHDSIGSVLEDLGRESDAEPHWNAAESLRKGGS